MESFDHVIVGAGSAGCVLADRLSADGRSRVLVLEAGGSDRRLWVRLPIGYGRTFHDPQVNWRFSAEPDPALGGRSLYWPRGRGLGGSSAINGLVYCRGLPGDFEDWAAAGNPGWGAEAAAEAFSGVERRLLADGRSAGTGPLAVADREGEYHPLRRHFYAGSAEAGLPRAADLAAPEEEGIGAWSLTTRAGLRCSAADAFLRPALGRRNLALRMQAHVTRVLFEGKRATGIEYRRGGVLVRVRAGSVILAAGAVQSPQILQLSGIGPGALLRDLGVPVVHENAAVGGGLQDHIGIDYLLRATEPTLNQALGTWRGRVAAAVVYLLRRGGPLSLSVNQMGGLLRSRPGLPRPDIQLYFNPLSYSVSHVGRRPLLKPDPWPGFALGFNACRPTSRGRVDIASPDPAAAPRIRPGYLSTEEDVAGVLAGARLIERLLGTAAFRALVAEGPGFRPDGATDEAVLADFRARSGSVFHACGTCRMAPEAAGGVVDARLRVHGIEGLRVVDASVFPNITSANTNAPTLMLAARAAGMIRADTGTGP